MRKFEVGGFAYYSWGYGQTNIEWFKVVRNNGKSVWLEAVKSQKSYDGDMHGSSQPVDEPRFSRELVYQDGDYVDVEVQESSRKKIHAGRDGSEMAAGRFGGIYPWDGRPKFFSEWY